MRQDRRRQAATLLAEARSKRRPFDALPDACRPKDEAEAYAVQATLHDRLQAADGGAYIGHKIGCTTDVMQRYLDIPSPCAGGLCDKDVYERQARLRHEQFLRPGVECEIAVRLGADLPPRDGGHDRNSVGAAVETCMAAIEIVDDRYVDYRKLDTPTLIADDFFNAGAVLGPAVSDWRSLDLAGLEGHMAIDGVIKGEGVGAAILGHPFEALAWLADARNTRGSPLRQGEIVLLGSIVQTAWIDPGAKVEILIEGLGTASLTFD